MPAVEKKKRETALTSDTANDEDVYITGREFSALAGINMRNARNALTGAFCGKLWRGHRLDVALDHSPDGGGGGGKRYLVAVASLPEKFRALLSSARSALAPAGANAEPPPSNERTFVSKATRAPWDQAQREAAHELFRKLPSAIQQRATDKVPSVRLYFEVLAQGASKAKALEIAARETGTTPRTLRLWVRKCRGHDAADWRCVLVDAEKGKPQRVELPHEAKLWMNRELLSQNEPHIKPVWKRFKREAAAQGWPVVSYATFRRRFQEIPQSVRTIGRKGEKAFADGYFKLERDYAGLDVHQVWSCDGRDLDVVCTDGSGKPYRPRVVVFTDVRSRVVCGAAFGKTESAALIQAAFLDALKRTRHFPYIVQPDNGRGFNAHRLTGGAATRRRFAPREDELLGLWTNYGIELKPVLPHRGRSKPVESFWNRIAELDRRCGRAYCGNAPGNAPEQHDPAHAITLEAYRKLFEETLAMYHEEPHSGHAMFNRSPNDIYSELLAQPKHSPARAVTAEMLRDAALSRTSVKLSASDYSIRLHGNRYYHDRLAELDRSKNYTAHYDPNDASVPIAVYDGAVRICDATLRARTGYLNEAAAKEGERNRRAAIKFAKQRLEALTGAQKGRSWLRPELAPASPEPPAEALRAPSKVAALAPPTRRYKTKRAVPDDEKQTQMLETLAKIARAQSR